MDTHRGQPGRESQSGSLPSGLTPRDPATSEVIATHIVLPGDTNALQTAFGGKLMEWIDVAAAVAARRHCGQVAVTASIDSVEFRHPVQLGDVVILRAA